MCRGQRGTGDVGGEVRDHGLAGDGRIGERDYLDHAAIQESADPGPGGGPDLDENAPEDETGEEASIAAALESAGTGMPGEPAATGATDAPAETFATETDATETNASETFATETNTTETAMNTNREHAEVETAPHD